MSEGVVLRLVDDAGNRENPAQASDYDYDVSNRITVSPGFSYAFDADGNLETIHDDAGTPNLVATLAWDFTNRLQTHTEAAGQETTYRYDPFGRRIQKSVDPDGAGGSPAATTWYVWDGDMLLGEYDASGGRDVRYAYAGGYAPVQVAYDDGASGEDVFDVHTDHLDTPRLLTDDTGAIAWQSSHEAYGAAQITNSLGSGRSFDIRFPGQYYDAETGLHYNRFRYYDPSIGRYVSADPVGQIESQSTNLFIYANLNPTGFSDPSGLLVEVRCRSVGSLKGPHNRRTQIARALGGKHCFVYISCPEAGIQPTTISYLGTVRVSVNGHPSNNDTEYSAAGAYQAYPVSPAPNDECCDLEWRILKAALYQAGTNPIPNYNPVLGPNSNTFAKNLVGNAGGTMGSQMGSQASVPGW